MCLTVLCAVCVECLPSVPHSVVCCVWGAYQVCLTVLCAVCVWSACQVCPTVLCAVCGGLTKCAPQCCVLCVWSACQLCLTGSGEWFSGFPCNLWPIDGTGTASVTHVRTLQALLVWHVATHTRSYNLYPISPHCSLCLFAVLVHGHRGDPMQ